MTKSFMSPPLLLSVAIAVALALPGVTRAQSQPAHTATVTSSVEEVHREEKSVTATVVSVDVPNRMVTLKGPKGDEQTVEVRPDVKNLDQVKPGDQVTARYESAMAVQLMPAGSAKLGSEVEGGTTTSDKGNKPGRVTGHSVTVTTKLTAVDAKNNTVTLTGADGHSRTIDVKDPDLRKQLKDVKVGDLVSITYVEALAITVTPKAKPKE